MAEMLLINPRRRTRKAAKAKRRVRRHNPLAAVATRRAAPKRRRNPIGLARVTRRRRNPIGLGGSGIAKQLQDALMGGAGAVAVDALMGQLNGYLPDTMKRVPGTVGVGDAVKMGITIAAGQMLSKATRGASRKLAAGALICQARDILSTFVPSTMAMGYASPARIVQGNSRVSPINRMGAYQRPDGGTPLLAGVGAYQRPGGGSSLLNGAARRETVRY